MRIKVELEQATIPTKGSRYAAGYDLYATEDVVILQGQVEMIDTGIAVELPAGTFGAVFSRSGLSTKRGLVLANGVGVIDEDYRGAIHVPLRNMTMRPQTVREGERIAQLVVVPYLDCRLEIVNELSDTERGAGGFGSTGKY